jgi:hypothetical protein
MAPVKAGPPTRNHESIRRAARAGLALACGLLVATLAEAAPSAPVAVPGGGLPRIPAVDAANALEGKALVEALRAGGFVLYLRHTETGTVTETCDTSNLTEAGRQAARKLGEDITALKLPIDKVISSEICRVWETAKLMDVAPIETHPDLYRQPKSPEHKIGEGRWRLITQVPGKSMNRLLAGHMQHGNGSTDRLYLDMGEIIVFRPDGKGNASVVARIRAGEWEALAASVAPGGSR